MTVGVAGVAASLTEAVGIVFSWPALGLLVAGVLCGILLGAIPGVGSVIGMAITLPLTIPLSGAEALIFLTAIYSGAMYGSSVSAILINVPGTPAAAASIYDGYPLTKQGKGKNALGMSATASALGGTTTMIALLAITPLVTSIVLLFETPHVFLVTILGIIMIAVIAAQGSTVKGVLAGAFGLLIMTVGTAPTTPTPRFTFGTYALLNGFSFVAILLGVFAIGEMIRIVDMEGGIADEIDEIGGSVLRGVRATVSNWLLMLRSAFIGMGIGSMPGAGGAVSNFVSYAFEVKRSDDSDTYGDGNPRGLIAAESSNNGTVAGSLIPVLSFGIPGSPSTAILLGAFLVHGIDPGPTLFENSLELIYALIVSLVVSNVFIIVVGLILIAPFGYKISLVDTKYLVPIIVVLASLGTITLRSNPVDLLTILVFGVIGLLMKRYDYSIIALVLGAVLGTLSERTLNRSLILSDGSLGIFVGDPLAGVLVGLIAVVLLIPILQGQVRRLWS
jgi:putative tricarboxylic transport membrane protein